MKVLALFSTFNHTILRRVLAPYAALVNRGEQFTFRQVLHFDADMAHSAHITVLPNWILSDEEVESLQNVGSRCSFVYDLSDPALLQNEQVQKTLTFCRAVTVPNAFLQKEVQGLLNGSGSFGLMGKPRVFVTPSCLDVPFFMRAHDKERQFQIFSRWMPILMTNATVIGCFGPHDWHLIKDVVAKLQQDIPHLVFIGDKGAAEVMPEIQVVPDLVDYLPFFLNRCAFGLCPREGASGEDTFWVHEYGILTRPVIASANSAYTKESSSNATRFVPNTQDAWEKAIRLLTNDGIERNLLGNGAFIEAQRHRSTKMADQYKAILGKLLPHSLAHM